MADFLTAYKRTSRYEGGYANDAADRGGETYKGIARKMHPNWQGWVIIDAYKKDHGQLKRGAIINDPRLDDMVIEFYRREFWNKVRGDDVKDQDLANMLYDDAVNTGPKPAIKKLQTAAFALTGADAEKALAAKQAGISFGEMDAMTLKKINNVV
jgi:lysozyme family protein